jgi:gliding motility-associated-like protein
VTGCTNLVTKPIAVTAAVTPVITPSANPICPGDVTTLSVAGTFNSFDWSTGGSGSSVDITLPGNYSVNTLDQNNCASLAALTIDSKPTFTITVTADKTAINPGEQVQLTATAADTYFWSPALTLDNATIANPVAKPTTTTTYIVVGTMAGFCDASDSVLVTVNNGGAAAIKPPVLFSPNGDVVNDTWLIQGVENYPDCTMSIYDGHGSKVYEIKGYNSSNSWDGTYGGKSVPDGTYYYVFGCPDLRPATGNVLVVR